MTRRRATADRGTATLEAVIWAPVLLMFAGLIIAAGRIVVGGGAVEAAARDAARQASLARTPSAARSRALASAEEALHRQGLQCDPTVAVDTSEFGRPPGTAAAVSVTVECVVRLSDLVVAGLPGARTMRASAVSPIDPYRGR
ncbi:TadE/TadG family type IV pilus assembly protein [Actinomadura chibensis]|uniref:Pilus assembly protein n=1 Tax=Actinomadura chibensis TaxID=392828 RepID=A0A5D0NVV4_9ACTN|nr:TadE/TadG family type IV pilus assembly protein [Actinomadura chibensis]TYB48547.1 pilus assembly protein [Actinomadura chibensis]